MKKVEIAAMQKYANSVTHDWLRAKIAVTKAMINGDSRAEKIAREEVKTYWNIRYGVFMTLREVGLGWTVDTLSLELDKELDALDEQLKPILGIK